MEVRIKMLVRALAAAPHPRAAGEIRKVIVPKWTVSERGPESYAADAAEPVDIVTLRAEKFADGHARWLEWMIEV